MIAQQISAFGDSSVFKQVEIPVPDLKPGHVLIRVAASSVNPMDYKVRRHGPPIAPALPAVLHADVAGTLEAVGEGVTEFKPGDEVYGCAGGVKGQGGALAEFMLADARLVALKPETLSMAEAAALPLVAITAWEGLIEKASVQAGQTVLVHGGSGGVGHIALQLAKWCGAKVFATASSPEKSDIVRSLGATEVIDYKNESVHDYITRLTGGEGFDMVFDSAGGANLPVSFEAAKLNGVVITPASSCSYDLSVMHNKGLSLHVVFMLLPMLFDVGRERHGEILRQVAKLADEGVVKPLVDDKRFTFAEVGQAHDYLESGAATGKVVLTW